MCVTASDLQVSTIDVSITGSIWIPSGSDITNDASDLGWQPLTQHGKNACLHLFYKGIHCLAAVSVVTKAVDAETETKTEAAGFETEAKTETVVSETEAKTEAVYLKTEAEARGS